MVRQKSRRSELIANALGLLLPVLSGCDDQDAGFQGFPGRTLRVAVPAPLPRDRIDPQSTTCLSEARTLDRLTAQYDLRVAGTDVFIDPGIWYGRAQREQDVFVWALAFRASCSTGSRGVYTVRIIDREWLKRDPEERIITYQPVSPEQVCMGDHAVIRPMDFEYNC